MSNANNGAEFAQQEHVPKILLVEDDEDIARLVQLHLKDINAEVVHCSRGDTALEAARNEPWDSIVLDLRQPRP